MEACTGDDAGKYRPRKLNYYVLPGSSTTVFYYYFREFPKVTPLPCYDASTWDGTNTKVWTSSGYRTQSALNIPKYHNNYPALIPNVTDPSKIKLYQEYDTLTT